MTWNELPTSTAFIVTYPCVNYFIVCNEFLVLIIYPEKFPSKPPGGVFIHDVI